ncbi:oligosaccharide flippase family protein [Sphingomonas sp.]|uniref:oligosaccharide flippase family protein n=1 Tax=Sphingomonas sp. TaxID=28214 RepID=UPI00389E1382
MLKRARWPADTARLAFAIASEQRALLRSTIWSLVLRILGMLATFAFGVQVARILGPGGFGTYGLVLAIALLLSVVAQFGLHTVGTREISIALANQRWRELRGYVYAFFNLVLCFSLALAALWGLICISFPGLLGPVSPNLAGTMLVPLFALTVFVSAALRALDHIVIGQSLETFVRPILTVVLLCGVLIAGVALTPAFAVAIMVVAAAIALILGIVGLRNAIPSPARRGTKSSPRGWIRPAFRLTVVDLLKQVDATSGLLLLGALSIDAEVGYFRVALSTVILVSTPISILNVVLAPSLARFYSNRDFEKLQQIMLLASVAMFLPSIAAFFLIAAVGKPLIVYLFGAQYAASWIPLLLLTAAQVVNGFFGVGWVFLSMSGGERALTRAYGFSVAVSVMIAAPLAMIAGAIGVSIASVVGALVQNLILWRAVRTHSNLDSSAAALFWRPRFSSSRS